MNHEHSREHGHDPHDWDLPISLADAEALGRRLDHASDTDTIISNRDAQTIAICLSDQLGFGLQSAMRQFAELGSINAPVLRAECLSAHARDELTPGLRRWAAWLFTYVAYALPSGVSDQVLPVNGDALDAYLRLPDIEPVSGDALADFARLYCGSYFDFDAVIDGLTDAVEWEKKIRAFARDLGCEEFVSIDREAIGWHVRDGWDIIPSHGRLHVFFR